MLPVQLRPEGRNNCPSYENQYVNTTFDYFSDFYHKKCKIQGEHDQSEQLEEDIWKIQSNSSVSEGLFLGVRGASAETEEDLTKRKLQKENSKALNREWRSVYEKRNKNGKSS